MQPSNLPGTCQIVPATASICQIDKVQYKEQEQLTTPNLEGDTPELLSLITLTPTNQHIKEYKLLAVNMG